MYHYIYIYTYISLYILFWPRWLKGTVTTSNNQQFLALWDPPWDNVASAASTWPLHSFRIASASLRSLAWRSHCGSMWSWGKVQSVGLNVLFLLPISDRSASENAGEIATEVERCTGRKVKNIGKALCLLSRKSSINGPAHCSSDLLEGFPPLFPTRKMTKPQRICQNSSPKLDEQFYKG